MLATSSEAVVAMGGRKTSWAALCCWAEVGHT